ncbi:MAG: FtsX-like permease family protein [Flavobacteriales bacterium]|nr:FtsX-like permease family protein [Flavobacteriales bacterium]
MIIRFIASRMSGAGGGKLSKPVVIIATAGVAIGVALMIISVAIVTGFQQEVRDKVVGFGAHFQIVNTQQTFNKESSRVPIDQEFYPTLQETPGIRHIQIFATKPGIMETKSDLQGCVIKGIGEDFDWSFFQNKIEEGDSLRTAGSDPSPDLMISRWTAKRMKIGIGDKVTLYFVLDDGDIRPRNFNVTTIYSTGLKEFDEEFVFVDIAHLQRINKWGIEAQILVQDSCYEGTIGLEGLGFGGKSDLTFRWPGTELEGRGPHRVQVKGDTTFMVVVEDRNRSLPDTAWASIQFASAENVPCVFTTETRTSGGSWDKYAGGFEVLIDDYDDLRAFDDEVFYMVPYYMQVQNVADRNPEIFSWLEMLDLNVDLIIYMMIFIAVVNMTSALLIIILERTNMIGMLKAFGMKDREVVFVFVRHAARIIGLGMLIGNLLGFGLSYFQLATGAIALNPESYYVDYVPIKFDWMYLLQIELVTFVICVLFMLLPALYVAKITPVKAIRFD